jgi:hypothetical protein
MNFGVIVNDLNGTRAFVLLGLLLPAAAVVVSMLLFRRLLRRFKVAKPTDHGRHS